MKEEFLRTAMLFGEDAIERLGHSHIAVFGVGGVGGYTVEALARSGVGTLTIVDSDTVSLSNINRQIIALHSTVGKKKVDVVAERIHDINPDCAVNAIALFFLPQTAEQFDFKEFDYIVDAVDTISAKVALAKAAKESGVPIISAMGAGNRKDPTAFKVTDIYATSGCPLARTMRHELRQLGIESLKVVCSDEQPVTPFSVPGSGANGKPNRPTPASSAFSPSVAGLIIAAEVVNDLINAKER